MTKRDIEASDDQWKCAKAEPPPLFEPVMIKTVYGTKLAPHVRMPKGNYLKLEWHKPLSAPQYYHHEHVTHWKEYT
jgi:hypothetical protein